MVAKVSCDVDASRKDRLQWVNEVSLD